MKKLRLLITEQCNRNCEGCCNKEWDLKKLPVCTDFQNWDQIILTGGEPMLVPQIIRGTINKIKNVNPCPIILYTAKVDKIQSILSILFFVDGLTVTLHETKDVIPFMKFNKVLPRGIKKTLRLNIFKEVKKVPKHLFGKWVIKDGIEWIKECPLPKDETFMRI